MKHTKISAMFAVPMALAFVPTALAQDAPTSPFSLKLGATYLTSSGSRDATNDVGFVIGGLYNLPMMSTEGGNLSQAINFDYVRTGGTSHIESFGLTYDVRFPLGDSAGGLRPYAGLGVGAFRNTVDVVTGAGGGGGGGGGGGAAPTRGNAGGGGGGGGGGAATVHQTSTGFGGRLILGAWFSERFFGEIEYRLSGSRAGVDTNTVNLLLGVRF